MTLLFFTDIDLKSFLDLQYFYISIIISTLVHQHNLQPQTIIWDDDD